MSTSLVFVRKLFVPLLTVSHIPGVFGESLRWELELRSGSFGSVGLGKVGKASELDLDFGLLVVLLVTFRCSTCESLCPVPGDSTRDLIRHRVPETPTSQQGPRKGKSAEPCEVFS